MVRQWLTVLVILTLFALSAFGQTAKTKDIYDVKAEGSKQIEKALAEAKKDKKNVLLQFGANWCHWCHLLHDLFHSDKAIAAELKKNFVTVMIDVDKEHNSDINQKYGNPIQHGLPVIVILDRTGKQLTTKDTGELEAGSKHDPDRVLAFLKKWPPAK